MLCNLCHGSGNMLTMSRQDSPNLQFWACPKCGGQGAAATGTQPPTIHIHKLEIGKYAAQLRKRARQAERDAAVIASDISAKAKEN